MEDVIFNIVFTDCGSVQSVRTFEDFHSAKQALDAELEWYRSQYTEDEENQEEYKYVEPSVNTQCSFLFKQGDARIDFIVTTLE